MPPSFRAVLALLLSSLLLPACAAENHRSPSEDGEFIILTTFTVLADITRNVAGPHARVDSITKPGSELHGYEPTPGDIAQASDADLVLYNGLNLEAWFEKFLAQVPAPSVVVSEGVELIEISTGEFRNQPNPHAWMSPLNVIIYVENIAQALSEAMPEHAADFSANAQRYIAELTEVHHTLVQALESLPATQRVLATCEGAFAYLARDGGLEELYLWPVNGEQQVTPGQMSAMIAQIDSREVPAVFCESTVSDAAMQQVVAATGATFGGTLYVDSLSEADGPVPTYLDLIRHDVNLIIAGLTESTPGGAS